ncbi:MAG: metallophosphoesterase [Actinomycetota bacterium]|nr:metallophosphoesterase [Actinomycetota bacterium]
MRRTALVLALVLAACSGDDPVGAPAPAVPGDGQLTTLTTPATSTILPATTTSSTIPAVTLLAAGDIASCASQGDEATAALLDARPHAVVATLGDNVYENGTATEFANCYDPTWGRHKGRTRPALGNHEYGVFRAGGYYAAFGSAAGEPPLGWYSYDLGAWHVVVLNSNCEAVGCMTGGTQERWLREDLAAHPALCTLAIWHHPRWSSGTTHGPTPATAPLFAALYDHGVEILLSGHEHNYERFAPMNPAGEPDPGRGVRQFVVGTGGRSHYALGPPQPGSEARNDNTFGIIALTLRATSYQWQFVPVAGRTYTDSGSGNCH